MLVTSGATEAISDCLAALVEPGDEVVLIEPLYDCYLPLVRRAGAMPRLVRVTPPDWRLDREALAAAFGPKTKAVLLNNPMNPAAKVFDAEELALIAELVVAHDAYRDLRRGLRAHPLRRPEARAADDPARACASGRSGSARPARPSP